MNDLWLIILYALISLGVIGSVVIGLMRTSRKRGGYTGVGDANDPASPTFIDTLPGGQRPAASPPDAVPAPEAPSAKVPSAPLPGADELPPPPGVDEPTVVERPEPVAGRLQRLRARLARSNSALGRGLFSVLSADKIDESTWEELEETLLAADIGAESSLGLVERVRERVRVEGTKDIERIQALLRDELLALLDPQADRSIAAERRDGHPAVILVVGVNGVGKTTTVGKLARVLVAEEKHVVLGAADTFRAAAAEQLTTWGERVGVPTIFGQEGADPASVAFEAVRSGVEREADAVLVDTAGRLHTKVGLMDELGKVQRVIEKQAPVREALLVLDATTGQNGLNQARVFAEVVKLSGIVLTKLDGTAKGGIVVAIQQSLGVPVKLVGLGEGPDDLALFEPAAFVDALFE